jgi:hypothetical protein
MNVLSPNDPNVYQTNMQVNTLFEGYPDSQLTIPIDGPYVGANLQYDLIVLPNPTTES